MNNNNNNNNEKAVGYEREGDANCSKCFWNSPKMPGKETKRTEDQRKNQDYSDYSTVKII